MTQNDPKNWTSTRQWVSPASHNAVDIGTVDTPIDTLGWRYAKITVSLGALAAAWTITVEASATSGGTYVNVAGAVFTVLATDDDTVKTGILDLHGINMIEDASRFLQLNGTGAAGADLLGVNIELFNPRDQVEHIDYTVGGADELEFDV